MRASPGLVFVLCASAAAAQERPFPFTWTSATSAPAANELELWLTPRLERQDGAASSRMELRSGLYRGVTARLDTVLGLDADLVEEGADSRSIDARVTSLWRYRLLDADDGVGLAGFARASLGFDALDLEVRLIADRRFGALVLAGNVSVTHTAQWNGRLGLNWRFEETLAVGYTVGPVVAALEARARTAAFDRHLKGTAFYVGPSVSWSLRSFWLAAAFEGQVAALKASADVGNGEPLTLRDDERFVIRLMAGFRL